MCTAMDICRAGGQGQVLASTKHRQQKVQLYNEDDTYRLFIYVFEDAFKDAVLVAKI